MQSIQSVFNIVYEVLKTVIDGFLEFLHTIPLLFENISSWSSSLFPSDFAVYIIALVPIIIALVVIRFVVR